MKKSFEMPALKSQLAGSALFSKNDKHTGKQVIKHTDIQVRGELERATFYIWDDQQTKMDELKLNLRKKGIRTDKSELVRLAIDRLLILIDEEVKDLIKSK